MKRLVSGLVCIMSLAFAAAAEDGEWQWVIEGEPAGTNILYRPQQHIGDELDFDRLFIGAPEGAAVVAPTDGIVEYVSVSYLYSLSYMVGSGVGEKDNMQSAVDEIASNGRNGRIDPKYASADITIRLDDGRKIHVAGLWMDSFFKTGTKISRGDVIGRVRRAYRKIPEPSISVSVSDAMSRPADPMTPFGLKSTFIPPKEREYRQTLTEAEAKEDIAVIFDALREAYPSLHDVISDEELAAFESEIVAKTHGGISRKDFGIEMQRVAARIHDSHFLLYPDEAETREIALPQLYFGFFGGKLLVTMCHKPYWDYHGREIAAVDGIPADSIRGMVESFISRYDAGVRSRTESMLALGASGIYQNFAPNASRDGDMTIEFADGERREFKGWKYRGGDPELRPNWNRYMRTNMYRDGNCSMRELNDSTAYIGISTFVLNETEVDGIRDYIAAHAATPNLIIDVRNNGGGDTKVLARILSYLLDKPSKARGGYAQVLKRGRFESMKRSLNRSPEDFMFEEYAPEKGIDGFVLRNDETQNIILPDSAVNYKGRIYVLADENSVSAAAMLPAAVMRNHRGAIVGRETRTAYHYMTAYKFAEIQLPNSMFTFYMPLVRLVFDTTECDRIPYGRGVLPDYEVPLTSDEIFGEKDVILERALELIADGEYLGDDPFAEADKERGGSYIAYCLAAAAASIIAIIAIFAIIRRRRR